MKSLQTLLPLIVFALIAPASLTAQDVQERALFSPIEDIPTSIRLEGLLQVYQDTNRCSAAALSIQLSYFEQAEIGYRDVIARLNPYGGDVSVRIEEMADVAISQGLNAIVRRGGTLDLMRQLLAAGYPVLVENVYYDGPNGWDDWLSHNRVLTGYDDALQVVYFYDPLLGNGDDKRGRAMDYADIDERWQAFNRDFLLIYPPEDETIVRDILGEDYWDAQANARLTAATAQYEIDNNLYSAGYSHFNLGWALVQLGEYEAAAQAFDTGRERGIPWRMYWYEFGIFEAYLNVGRYDDVINLVFNVLQTTDGVEEMYYYIARAYYGKGDIDRAIANLEAALYRNRYFQEASTLMVDLIAERNGEGNSEGATYTAGVNNI